MRTLVLFIRVVTWEVSALQSDSQNAEKTKSHLIQVTSGVIYRFMYQLLLDR